MIYDELKIKDFIRESISNKGRLPSLKELTEAKLITRYFINNFGGYVKFIEDLGYKYDKQLQNGFFYNKTEQDVINIFNNFYTDKTPTRQMMEDDYKNGKFEFGKDKMIYMFGDYENFLGKCNRKPYKKEVVYETKYKHTKDDIFKILKSTLSGYDKIDSKLITKLYLSNEIPFGEGVIKSNFGCISQCLYELGMVGKIGKNAYRYLTKEEMISHFKLFYPDLSNPPSQLDTIEDCLNDGLIFNSEGIRAVFGSYSKFLIESGYCYNKGKYSQKHLAFDGEICDSKSELLIDTFLHDNEITHRHHARYSNFIDNIKKWHKCDFVLSDGTIVEYFGLLGIKKYDMKTSNKLKLLEDNQMKYITIYPKDLKILDIIFADYIERGN